MSVKVMGKVWELDLPANEKFVLLALADHADHDGNNVFPGLELIAFKTGYTTQQVRRIERKLETRGILIALDRKPGKKIVYRIDTNIGVCRERLTPIKMSPLTKSNPLHSDTSTPYISSTESTGINRQLEPSTIVGVEKPKIEREHDPVFDAVAEHIFGIALDQLNGTGVRVGILAAWLNGKSDGVKHGSTKTEVGFISAPAKPEHIAAFAAYWKSTSKANIPYDLVKFVDAWRKWVTGLKGQTVRRAAQKATTAPEVKLSASEIEARKQQLDAARKGETTL